MVASPLILHELTHSPGHLRFPRPSTPRKVCNALSVPYWGLSWTRVRRSGQMPNEAPTPEMPPLELTLVVAATRNMGIGRAGTLPWTGLKREMAYFARVTKRLPDTVGVSLSYLIICTCMQLTQKPRRNRPP